MFKRLTFLLLAFFVLPLAMHAQTHYVVSVGSGTATSAYVPDYGYYNYCYTQSLYTAAEVGIDGEVDTVAFQVGSGGLVRTLNIYMGEVGRTWFGSAADAVGAADLHLVYSGSVSWSAGWVTIALDSVFSYRDTGSLVIAVVDQTGSYNSSYPYFVGTLMGNNRSLYDYDDYTTYAPGSPLGSTSQFLPNIRLGITSYSLYCAQPSNVAVSGIHDDEATFSWHENGIATGEYTPKPSYKALCSLTSILRGTPRRVPAPVMVCAADAPHLGGGREPAEYELISGMFELANGARGFAYWQPTPLHTVTLDATASFIWHGIDKAPLLADPLEGTVEPLPEKCVRQLAKGTLCLDHVPLRDTPLFLLDGTPWA